MATSLNPAKATDLGLEYLIEQARYYLARPIDEVRVFVDREIRAAFESIQQENVFSSLRLYWTGKTYNGLLTTPFVFRRIENGYIGNKPLTFMSKQAAFAFRSEVDNNWGCFDYSLFATHMARYGNTLVRLDATQYALYPDSSEEIKLSVIPIFTFSKPKVPVSTADPDYYADETSEVWPETYYRALRMLTPMILYRAMSRLCLFFKNDSRYELFSAEYARSKAEVMQYDAEFSFVQTQSSSISN
jgi:hypothetical protein